jgi:hypothetical protein
MLSTTVKKNMYIWVPAVCQLLGIAGLYWLIIRYVMYSERDCCCNAQNYFAVACSYLMERPSFVTGNEWSQSDKKDRYGYQQCVKWYI